MTAPAVIQNTALTTATVNATTLTLTGVTAGSTLVVLIAAANTSTRTYTVTDDQGNTWSSVGSIAGRACRVAYCTNAASGTTQITVTQSGVFAIYTIVAVEVEACTFVEESTYTDLANNTTHFMAASGKLDVASDGIILGIGLHNASGGALTKGSSHTLIGTPTTTIIAQYIRSDAGFVDERSPWTTTTARTTHGASAAFEAVAGGGAFKSQFAVGSNVVLGV